MAGASSISGRQPSSTPSHERSPFESDNTQIMPDKMWNLTADQWSSVLRSNEDPATVAARLPTSGGFVPWSRLLLDESADCKSTADLGSGRGEHSAVLARAG